MILDLQRALTGRKNNLKLSSFQKIIWKYIVYAASQIQLLNGNSTTQ